MAAFDAIAISELLLQEMKVVHQETGVIVLLSSNLVFVDRVLKGLSGGAFTCDEYLSVLKCLRHACAGNFPNAKLLTELQVPGAVLDFLSKSYAAYLDEKDYLNNNTTPSHNAPRSETPSDAQLKTLLTLTTQVLANFSACKDTSCSSAATPLTVNTLWSLGGVDVFSSLVNMAASLSAQGALAATFAALYSCLLSAELGASAQVAASRQLCCQLALSVLDLQYAELSSKGGCGGGGSALSAATSAPPSVEWFQLLVLQLLKEGQAVRALQSVKRSEQMLAGLAAAHAECFSVTMTHEEVIFLCALDSCLDDHSSLAGAVQGEAGQAALLGLLRHVAALMTPRPGMTSAWYPGVVPVEASSVAVDEEFAVYLTAGRPAPPSGSPAEQDVQLDIDSLATPAASVCVNILAKLAALSNAALGECAALSHGQMSRALTLGEALKQALLEAGVLNICCSCLTGLHKIKSGVCRLVHLCVSVSVCSWLQLISLILCDCCLCPLLHNITATLTHVSRQK